MIKQLGEENGAQGNEPSTQTQRTSRRVTLKSILLTLRALLSRRPDGYDQLNPKIMSVIVIMTGSIAAAVVAIIYAKLVDRATETMAEASVEHAWLFVGFGPVCMVIAWALVHYFEPTAGGSGIPQVLAAVATAGKNNPPVMRTATWWKVRLILVKISSSLAGILGGGVVGREGPTIQIAATVFELFDDFFYKLTGKRQNRESLLVAGGGAGLAAAFNTPLGGVVFAIEELAKNHFNTFKGVLILGVVTAGFVTQAARGPYLFVGHVALAEVAWKSNLKGLLVAAVIGIIGALFAKILFDLVQLVKRWSPRQRLLLAAVCGLSVAGACALLGPEAAGGGHLLIRRLLFGNAKEVNIVVTGWRVVGLVITYISGCASGIFAPSLAAGAALGAKCAEWLGAENPNLIVVIGMIAFLAGATRSPFTSFVLVFEMTDRQAAIIPMLAGALVASMAARVVEHESFYEKSADILLGRHPIRETEAL